MSLPDTLRPIVDHAPKSLVVLDFDGTISSLVEHPDDAVAIDGVVAVLCELTAFLDVAFITGRPVDWLVDRTAPCSDYGVDYIGLHGHERLHNGVIVAHAESAPWRDKIADVHAKAKAEAPDDVVIEMKGLGLALHFRTSPTAEEWIRRFTSIAARETGLIAHDTRYAIELRPPVDLDKGHAMQELIADYEPEAVAFFGDDLVDIPAVTAMRDFKELATVAVFVDSPEGPRAYAQIADLVLPGPRATADALDALRDAVASPKA